MSMALLLSQLFYSPPLPNADFAGKTVIVTGANVGLGKDAVKHFVRLGASRVIGTSRSVAKGDAALDEIEAETNCQGNVAFWELDYGSYASVKAFCTRVASELDRVDAVVLNAGIAARNYEILEGEESVVVVNVISTTLLAILLLPVLRDTADKYNTTPTLAVTCSEVHSWAKFPERDAPNIFEALNDPQTKTMNERYETSKLLQLFLMRELAARTASSLPFVVINTASPGLNKTSLTRSTQGMEAVLAKVLNTLVAWEPEVGARTLVHATVAGRESHGVLLNFCQIENDALAPWIDTDIGHETQRKVWKELEAKLEEIQPGVLSQV